MMVAAIADDAFDWVEAERLADLRDIHKSVKSAVICLLKSVVHTCAGVAAGRDFLV